VDARVEFGDMDDRKCLHLAAGSVFVAPEFEKIADLLDRET